DAAREAGCDDVSVDLMYGLPGLAVDAWAADVERVLDWGPDHVSAYALTLDGGSPWGAGGVVGLPDEDAVVAAYWALVRAAAARGTPCATGAPPSTSRPALAAAGPSATCATASSSRSRAGAPPSRPARCPWRPPSGSCRASVWPSA